MTEPVHSTSTEVLHVNPTGLAEPASDPSALPQETIASRPGWPVGALWLILLLIAIAWIGHSRWNWWPETRSAATPPAIGAPAK